RVVGLSSGEKTNNTLYMYLEPTAYLTIVVPNFPLNNLEHSLKEINVKSTSITLSTDSIKKEYEVLGGNIIKQSKEIMKLEMELIDKLTKKTSSIEIIAIK
ncbi:MAG: hypothetical protein OH363_03575, partial [Candidatus Parvarchaeota archaeon]|nr:hypothetical protein [Candidatus Jingweiarchaeum tengchongense]